MSAFSTTICLVYTICYSISECQSFQFDIPKIYSIRWTSYIPQTQLIAADTLQIHSITLFSDQKESHTIPNQVTGLKDSASLLSNSSQSTYPIEHEFNIIWNFDGIYIDHIRIITNCGSANPSLFCNNSIIEITNASTTYTQTAQLTDDMYMHDLHGFVNNDNCPNNILLLDTVLQGIEGKCGLKCEVCLHHLYIDLNKNTLHTSHTNEYGLNLYNFSGFGNTINCSCPTYNLSLINNNQLEVFENDENQTYVGLFIQGATAQRVQMSWNRWMGDDITPCRLSYLPNTDEFISIPSWRAVAITFEYSGSSDHQKLVNDYNLRLQVEEYLNKQCNTTWVNTVSISTSPITTYIINITSHDYPTSFDAIYIARVIRKNRHTMTAALAEILENYLGLSNGSIHVVLPTGQQAQTAYTKDLPYTRLWIPSPSDKCESYFQTTTTSPMKDTPNLNMPLIGVITVVVVTIIVAIIILICYKKNKNNLKKDSEWSLRNVTPKTKSWTKTESVPDRDTLPTHQQINKLKTGVSTPIVIRDQEESIDEQGVYYGSSNISKISCNEYQPVNQSTNIELEILESESKISGALDDVSSSNRAHEFKDFKHEIKLFDMIGKGSFGKVYKAKWEAEYVAVKLFNSVNKTTSGTEFEALSDTQYKEIYAEIVLATKIPPHPNIIRINGFCREPLCVVMEYMAGGSVQKLVYGQTSKPLPSVNEKLVILVKACFGLAKLTEYKLHHRDIAARNILLGRYERIIDRNTPVKITDFGLTRSDGSNDENKTTNDSGPCKWMAPESIKKKIYNEKTDVYMFGITIWEIMYGREPYDELDGLNAAMNVCMKNERPEFLWDLPMGLKTLIKKCWDKDSNERPTFRVIAHKLENIQDSVESNIEEIHKMDAAVEEYQRKLIKAPSIILKSEANLFK